MPTTLTAAATVKAPTVCAPADVGLATRSAKLAMKAEHRIVTAWACRAYSEFLLASAPYPLPKQHPGSGGNGKTWDRHARINFRSNRCGEGEFRTRQRHGKNHQR